MGPAWIPRPQPAQSELCMTLKLIDDKVWWDRRRKLQGICEEVVQTHGAGGNILVLAHFDGTLSAVEEGLRGRKIDFERLAQIRLSTLCSASSGGAGKSWSGLARSIPAPTAAGNDWGAIKLQDPIDQSPQTFLNIIVAEHHPLRSRDEQLIASGGEITCEAQLTFHISLDDPLLIHFGVGSIRQLYQRLEVDEETALDNPLITRAISQAQKKIESQVPFDLPAWSIEDWFKHNLPE